MVEEAKARGTEVLGRREMVMEDDGRGEERTGCSHVKIGYIKDWDLKANIECAVSHPHKSVIRKYEI